MGALTGKRILVLANDIKTIRWFRMELLRALLGLGAEVHLVMPDAGDERDLLDMGCLIHHVTLSRHGCNPLVELGLLGQYRAIFQRLRPDLVLSFTIKPNIYGTLTAYRAGCPIVCNITGTGAAFLKNNGLSAVIRHLYRYALPHAHRVFFQNREDMHYFQTHRLLGGNGELLPWGSGVNLTLHTPSPMPPDGITHFVFVGRVVAIKGVDTLFACAERMAREKLPCRFHIAGLVEASRYQKRVKALREAGVLIDTRRARGDAAADGARGRLDELAAAGRCYELSRLAVNGGDIAALGYRGREIGDVLRRLLDAVMRGVPNERERLLAMAQNSGDARDKM